MGFQEHKLEDLLRFFKRERETVRETALALIEIGELDAPPVIEFNRWDTCYQEIRQAYLETLDV